MDAVLFINSTLAPPSGLQAVESFPLDSTFGAALLGTYFSLILFGGIIHQAFRYFQTFTDDSFWLKSLVALVVSAEGVHTALCMQTCYYFLVIGYSNLSTLTHIPLSLNALAALSGIIVVLSQVFFVRRAYIFGRQYRGWAILVTFLLLGEFVLSLGSSIDTVTTTPTSGLVTHPWMVAVAAAMAIAADSILTTIITVSLRRNRNGIKRTDSLIDILVLYSITNGLLTSACMLVLFVFTITRPNDMIYVALSFVVTKLYTNTLLAALNTRQSLREASSTYLGVEIFGTTGGPPQEQRSAQAHGVNGHLDTVSLELSDMRAWREGKA